MITFCTAGTAADLRPVSTLRPVSQLMITFFSAGTAADLRPLRTCRGQLDLSAGLPPPSAAEHVRPGQDGGQGL